MPCNYRIINCDTSDCIINLPSKCVTYDGPATTNIGYITNMKLTDLLLLIDTAIGSTISSGSRGYIVSSPTILVSSLGTSSNPYILTARISTDANNELTLGTDGALYVAPPLSSGDFDI